MILAAARRYDAAASDSNSTGLRKSMRTQCRPRYNSGRCCATDGRNGIVKQRSCRYRLEIGIKRDEFRSVVDGDLRNAGRPA